MPRLLGSLPASPASLAAPCRRRTRQATSRASGQQQRGREGSRRAPPEEEEEGRVLLSRSLLLSKSVITRTGGVNLGVVTQLWVDVDGWEVVALDVRPSALASESAVVALASLRQVGDVVLVHDERAARRGGPPAGSLPLIGTELLTQTGEFLGKARRRARWLAPAHARRQVRDYEFDPETGAVAALLFDFFGLDLVPQSVVSTYALDIEEVVSAGVERIIVRAGAEARLQQLSASLLQRLRFLEPPWEEGLRMAEAGYLPAPRERERDPRERWEEEAVSYDSFEPRRPRARAPEPELERRPRPARPRQEGIPLVRPSAPFERRDADGGFGEAAPPRPRASEASPAREFEAWVAREPPREREMEEMMEGQERRGARRFNDASDLL